MFEFLAEETFLQASALAIDISWIALVKVLKVTGDSFSPALLASELKELFNVGLGWGLRGGPCGPLSPGGPFGPGGPGGPGGPAGPRSPAGPCGPVLPPLSKKLVISNCSEVDIAVPINKGTSEQVSVDCAANVTKYY